MATELGKALGVQGHEVHFITYDLPVRLSRYSRNTYYHEVKVSEYPLFDYPPYELVLTNKLVDVAKYEKLDLLHVHYAIPHATAAYMAREILRSQGLNVPFITTLHGTDITLVGKDSSFEPAISFAINESDAVTAVSNSLKEDTLKHFAVDREIEVIPNFVCLEHYNPNNGQELRKEYAPNGELIVTHTSNFRKVKRVDDVIRIFSKVRERVNAKLLLVGDGPDRHRIEELCRELKTCDDVIMLGKMQSAEEVLSASDLFLLPSETESFGLAALEAMASGVPVISTNSGGLPEVNEHGVSGYLGEVGDVDYMANRAISLLSDEEKLSRFKQQALETAQKFDIEKILPAYLKLYQSLV